MQVIGRATKKKSGLRFWNRALGIKVNRNTPHTRQPLAGVTLWGLVVGMALALMGQVAWAQDAEETVTTHPPACQASDLFVEEMEDVTKENDQRYTIPIAKASEASPDLSNGFSVTPDSNDLVVESDTRMTDADPPVEEIIAHRGLLKITVPTNTAGMLSVETSQLINGGALCRGGTQIASFGYTITTVHDRDSGPMKRASSSHPDRPGDGRRRCVCGPLLWTLDAGRGHR